jgi:hypothetical protein
VWTLLGYYVAHEWEEVVRLGIMSGYQHQGGATSAPDMRLRVFSCPNLGDPPVDDPAPNGGDGYVFKINYFYVGGAAKWSVPSPPYSPIKPTDPPTWTLMVDQIRTHSLCPLGLATVAHKNPSGQPAGANHLLHDGHVDWVKWNGGCNMRSNTYWSATEFFVWRRTLDAP